MTTLDELISKLQIISRRGHGDLQVSVNDTEPREVWPSLTGIRLDGTCAVRLNFTGSVIDQDEPQVCLYCEEPTAGHSPSELASCAADMRDRPEPWGNA